MIISHRVTSRVEADAEGKTRTKGMFVAHPVGGARGDAIR